VALSGGRDSTFTLHYAVKHLGLRPLAITIDNGFMPRECVENVENAVRTLGVDHVTVRHDLVRRSIRPVLSAWLHRQSPCMISLMCLGCRRGLRQGFLRIAQAYDELGLCLFGSGEPETSFATAFFSGRASPAGRMVDMVCGMGMELARNPRYMLNPAIPCRMVLEYLHEYPPSKAIARRVRPRWRLLSVFRFIPWDEKTIMDVITTQLGWRKYRYSASAWRSDCKINLLKNALYLRTLGFTKNDELVSGMVRRGLLTREQALERLEKDNVIPKEFLQEFCREIAIPYERFRH